MVFWRNRDTVYEEQINIPEGQQGKELRKWRDRSGAPRPEPGRVWSVPAPAGSLGGRGPASRFQSENLRMA